MCVCVWVGEQLASVRQHVPVSSLQDPGLPLGPVQVNHTEIVGQMMVSGGVHTMDLVCEVADDNMVLRHLREGGALGEDQ